MAEEKTPRHDFPPQEGKNKCEDEYNINQSSLKGWSSPLSKDSNQFTSGLWQLPGDTSDSDDGSDCNDSIEKSAKKNLCKNILRSHQLANAHIEYCSDSCYRTVIDSIVDFSSRHYLELLLFRADSGKGGLITVSIVNWKEFVRATGHDPSWFFAFVSGTIHGANINVSGKGVRAAMKLQKLVFESIDWVSMTIDYISTCVMCKKCGTWENCIDNGQKKSKIIRYSCLANSAVCGTYTIVDNRKDKALTKLFSELVKYSTSKKG